LAGPASTPNRFNPVIIEAGKFRAGVALSLRNEIVGPYLVGPGTEEQKIRWLPGMATGELLGSVDMSELGSDLTARPGA
jgi:alkylation response protein AidB-like acyl-CoA dehydrogenase